MKSMKFHFKRVIGDVKLNSVELTTVLTKIRSLPANDDDGIQVTF